MQFDELQDILKNINDDSSRYFSKNCLMYVKRLTSLLESSKKVVLDNNFFTFLEDINEGYSSMNQESNIRGSDIVMWISNIACLEIGESEYV